MQNYLNRQYLLFFLFLTAYVCSSEVFFPPATWGGADALKLNAGATAALGFLTTQTKRCPEAAPASTQAKSSPRQGSGSEILRFIQSYAPSDCDVGGFSASAHLYDQALVLLAYLAGGRPDDLNRAEALADALVLAQNNDRTFDDGRLRNAYACGSVIDSQSGSTRLPGRWNRKTQNFEEDEHAAGTDTGNMAWAAIALVQAQIILPAAPKEKYFDAAVRLANWIVKHTAATDSWGGFYGGLAGAERSAGDPAGQQRLTWRSTEHNIDLVALFKWLETVSGPESASGRHWSTQGKRAMRFINTMWTHDREGSYLLTGTLPAKPAPNRDFIPLDPQTWSVLAVGSTDSANPFTKALDWAVRNCKADNVAKGYDFNCRDGDGIWWEGTAQMAVALNEIGRTGPYEDIVRLLNAAQIGSGAAKGAMPAASKCGLTTGIFKYWKSTRENLPILYPDNPHIGATAWYIFAVLKENPFFLKQAV